MTIKTIIILWISSCLIAAGLGAYVVYHYYDKSIPAVQPGPVISKPIERPKDITCEQALGILYHYDHDPFIIKWKVKDEKPREINVNISGSLYQRDFTQDAKIPVAESGNFKLYLGIGIGTAATAGAIYGGYKLIQLMH